MNQKAAELLHTDFIKNRTIQICTFTGLIADFLVSHTMSHVLILFSLPYLTSVALNHFMKKAPKHKQKAKISEQFRPLSTASKIEIIPRS